MFVICFVILIVRGLVVIVVMNIVDVIIFFWNDIFVKKVLILCFVLFLVLDLYVLDKEWMIGRIIFLVCVVLDGIVGDKSKLFMIREYDNFNVFLLNKWIKM